MFDNSLEETHFITQVSLHRDNPTNEIIISDPFFHNQLVGVDFQILTLKLDSFNNNTHIVPSHYRIFLNDEFFCSILYRDESETYDITFNHVRMYDISEKLILKVYDWHEEVDSLPFTINLKIRASTFIDMQKCIA
jgi:hypothetical protein